MKQRDITIEQNLPLVHACARRFCGKGIEYDDLFAAGSLGLVKAVNNFDSSYGTALSTYAVPVILGEIRRLFRDGGAVKISRSLKTLAIKAKTLCDKYEEENGAAMPISLLAETLGTDTFTASEALTAAQSVLSLTGTDDDRQRVLDIPVACEEEKITDRLSLMHALEKLEEKDRELIRLRYFCSKTQAQTAAELNMTQVQVSRREKKILQLLRKDFED